MVFDTVDAQGGARVVDAMRGWSKARFNTIVYTHGHIDHVGGCGAFLADAASSGCAAARLAGHENVPRRFDRYNLTDGYNMMINARQFAASRGAVMTSAAIPAAFCRRDAEAQRHLQRQPRAEGRRTRLRTAPREGRDRRSHVGVDPAAQGDLRRRLLHLEFPERGQSAEGAALSGRMGGGDARRWPARAPNCFCRRMVCRSAVLRASSACCSKWPTRSKIWSAETLALMNAGAPLNDIIHTVKVAPAMLERPYLRPLYDEPEFVVRNLWRMYGGWYDGNPANLKPAKDAALAAEIAALAGGAQQLAARAQALAA